MATPAVASHVTESSIAPTSTTPPCDDMDLEMSSIIAACSAEDAEAEPRFVMDFSLLRVARQLRLLGFDAISSSSIPHRDVLRIAQRDGRTLITASRKMIPHLEGLRRRYENRPRVVVGYDSDGASVYETEDDDDEEETDAFAHGAGGPQSSVVAAPDTTSLGNAGIARSPPKKSKRKVKRYTGALDDRPVDYIVVSTTAAARQQMAAILGTVKLTWDPSRFFSRCVNCNGFVTPVKDKAEIRSVVDAEVYRVYTHFYRCPPCNKVFWGVEGHGVIVNAKAMQTFEHLRGYEALMHQKPSALALDGSAGPGQQNNVASLRRHFFLAAPRAVKRVVFQFLESPVLLVVGETCPWLRPLIMGVFSDRGDSFASVRSAVPLPPPVATDDAEDEESTAA